MGSDWQQAYLTDLYDIGSGLSKPAKDFGSGYPFLAFKDVFNNVFVPDDLEQLVQSNDKEQDKCSVKRGDVFLTRTSETMNELGMSSVALKDYDRATFNGFTKRLRPKEGNNLVPEYVAYYLRSPKFRTGMLAFSTMSTRASLNNEMISRLTIDFPPVDVQKQIADTLKAFDDKIELNRQINTTLESIVQALFKSWFVDFDPVIDNALAAGAPIPEELHARFERRKKLKEKPNNPHPPLPADIQQLFPSSFVFTEALGWVPEGWEEKTVADMVDSISDTYPLKDVERVVFLNTGDILDGRFLHSDYSATEGLPGQAKKSIRNGDILYSEIRPQNKRFAFVDFDGSEHVVSTKLMVLRAKNYFHPLFPYFVLKQERSINLMQHAAESRSGTFPQITYKQLDQLITCVPKDQGVTKMFVDMALKPIFEKGRKLDSQSETLSNIRDSLLPKLLSGQLQIPEAEQQLAEVI